MFIVFAGRPGGGKSYDAVRKIVHNLKIGRVVATNIDGMDDPASQEAIKQLAFLDDEQFHKLFIFLQKDDVATFWKDRTVNAGTELEYTRPLVPPGALVVLDEVHKWINSREWNSDRNKDFCEWGAEHRHDGYDVVLITQDINKIDKQIRSLVEWTYFYRKINFFGSLVKKKYVKYSYDGGEHEGKSPVPPQTYTYDPRYYLCYRSYKASEVVEKDFMTHINVLKHPVFYAIPVVFCFALYSLSKSSLATGDVLGGKARIASASAKVKAPAPVSSVSAGTPVAAPVRPVASTLPPVPPPAFVPMTSASRSASTPSDFVAVKFGFIEMGGKRVLLIGKSMVKLPSPSVRNLDFASRTCEVKRVLLESDS